MLATDIRVIDENTSDAKLRGACPSCAGTLDVRVSPEGVFTSCSTCHTLGRGKVMKGTHDGMGIWLRSGATA